MKYQALSRGNIGTPGRYLLQPWGYHEKTTSDPIEIEIHELKFFMGSIAFRCSGKRSDGTVDDQI